jgi:hypothetical protein
MTREEEILQQAKAYAKANRLAYPEVAIEHGFIHGAEWADEHPVRNTFACISLVSAEQAKKQMIDRACEWLLNHNDYLENPYANVTSFNMAKLVADFRKAMEK